ncbi:MFS transporter [Haloferacaceae archaeon DSL9]
MNTNDRSIVGFVSLAHATVHTYELSIPLLMVRWLTEFSTTAATLGAVVTVGYGLFGVGALPGGVLVDRFGSRPLVLGCLIGMAASFLVVGVAPSLPALAAAVGLWGLAASVYHPAGLSLISTGVTKPGRAFGYHGMAGNLGIALGPLATAVLLLAFEWRTVAVILTVPALVAFGFGLLVDFDEHAATERTDRAANGGDASLSSVATDTRALFTASFLLVVVIVTLNGLYYRAFLTFLPDLLGGFLDGYLGDLAVGPTGLRRFDLAQYLYVGLLLLGVVGQYLGGRLADRVRTERALVGAIGLLALFALLYVPAARAGFWPFLVVTGLFGVALFSVQPLTQATVAAHSAPEARGLSFGYTFLAIFGVGALGAAIAGATLTYASVTVLFVVLAVFAGCGCATSAVLLRRTTS